MNMRTKDIQLGNTVARYLSCPETGRVALQLIPAARIDDIVQRRTYVDALEFRHAKQPHPAWYLGSLVHLHLREDPQPGAVGMTLRGSHSVKRLRFAAQEVRECSEKTVIITTMEANETGRSYRCVHELSAYRGHNALEVRIRFENTSGVPLTLEMLSSFALDNLSPFQTEDGSGALTVYRQRGGWSLEGAMEKQSIEALGLERSWHGYFKEGERFGQVGSWPVKRYFPFVALEDVEAGVLWGARLAWPGSWQMEINREDDCLALNGGLADFEFGHWAKTIQPGESFEAPPAQLAVVSGDIEGLTHELTRLQHRQAELQPAVDQNLPIVFNEWCTSWGYPTHENLLALADRLQGSGVKYLVIDAGWTKQVDEGNASQGGNGDWIVDEVAFPQGIRAVNRELRERGLIPGVWFEFEVTTEGAMVFGPDFDDWHLKRHGQVIKTDGWRSFWDFRQQRVLDYLKEKVIEFLRENEFGYLKVDYNGNIGFGVDGAESLGEGLREHIIGVQNFFAALRRELPDLVIENCSSGGHRIEPSMIGLTGMTSVTDAHECVEIPRIAAMLRHAILPRQSSIWAVLQPDDSAQRIIYSLAATFLGRMCLSGPVHDLSEDQWNLVLEAMDFYQRVTDILKHGRSSFHGATGESIHRPQGTQAVMRVGDAGDRALVVAHSFDQPLREPFSITLPEGNWEIEQCLQAGETGNGILADERTFTVQPMTSWQGMVCLLVRR